MKPDYIELPDEQAAQVISTRVMEWDHQEPLRYAALGLMCHEVWKRLLWQYVIDPDIGFPCRSFARWVRVYAPNGYSTCYAAMRDVESLPDVPAEDIAQIPQSNFSTMKKLSTSVRRDPAVLEAAKGRTDGLIAFVQENHPDQHIDSTARMLLNLTEGAKAEIEEAVQMAIERGDSRSKEEAILMWAINFKQECRESLLSEGGR